MNTVIKNEQVSAFLRENPFVNGIVILNRDKIGFFPDFEPGKKVFYKKICAECMNKYSADADFFMVTSGEYICVFKRKKTVYVCETIKSVSVSQVRMELENFIGNQQKQGKLSKFFSSFFDR